jgi:hypothetical protein
MKCYIFTVNFFYPITIYFPFQKATLCSIHETKFSRTTYLLSNYTNFTFRIIKGEAD